MRFLNKMKGTLDSATRKSQDALEINKLNNQMKKLEGELDKLYRAIGERVVEDRSLSKQDTKSYLDVQVENIEHIKRQMDTMQKKIYFLKDLVACDSCSKVLPIRTKYCPDCGRNISELVKSVSKLLALEEMKEE